MYNNQNNWYNTQEGYNLNADQSTSSWDWVQQAGYQTDRSGEI